MVERVFAAGAAALDLEIPLAAHVLQRGAQLGVQLVVAAGLQSLGCARETKTTKKERK